MASHRHLTSSIFGLAPLAILAVMACSAIGSQDKDRETVDTARYGKPHLMPKPVIAKPNTNSAPQGAQLTYRGGPVIENAKVYSVFWGNQVSTPQATIDQFWSDITSSDYLTWLSEYNTPSQSIGQTSYAGTIIDSNAPVSANIVDSQIQQELSARIDDGTLPPADPNNVFMVFFPPGVTLDDGTGAKSCAQFCAYHYSFEKNGVQVIYAVIPDMGGACAGGCGNDPLSGLTWGASHELAEAMTDADVGANNLAWYDDQFGEIGDICNSTSGQVGQWTVQALFSNQLDDCVTSNPNATSSATTGTGTTTGTTGTGSTGSGFGGGGFGGGGYGGGGYGGGGYGGGWGGGWGGGSTGSGSGQCDHDSCTMGDALDPSCNQCADALCQYDDYCCYVAWDDICVSEGWDLGCNCI